MVHVRLAVALTATLSACSNGAPSELSDTASQKTAPKLLGDRVVDASTAGAKMLMGYQGWFGCPSDGSALSQWMHWSPNTPPTAIFEVSPPTS